MARMNDILHILADSPDGVYAVDLNQRIILWNRGAQELLGWAAEEVLGKHCYEVIAPPSPPSEWRGAVCTANCLPIQWARRAQMSPARTVPACTKGGQVRWLRVVHVLLPSENWDLSTLVHLCHDVSAEVRAREMVERLASFLQELPPVEERRSPTLAPLERLTPREKEVLRLLSQGLGTQAIAERLVISPTTVRNHVQHILSKLGAHTRLEAIALAFRYGLF